MWSRFQVPKFNRGSMPAQVAERLERKDDDALVLVQMKDRAGFWCNVHEGSPVRQAVIIAEDYSRTHQADTRVVRGQKREVVREFVGT